MVVADVCVEVVLVDDLAHVPEDLVGTGDGRPRPRLEPVPEGVQVAVGADARIPVHEPGATEALETFEHHEGTRWAPVFEVVCRVDSGDTGAHDEYVEVLRLGRRSCSGRLGPAHEADLLWCANLRDAGWIYAGE